ncbi:hypothetical protein SEMRO_996_G229360.1 [Seminavis robusta]|uniref:Uncharacterized protein n=1 Tax=Seminavis robusta TaxID=568900 RepID=A0A9N8EE97_9STRA|nr:hypothetical protein SEMRO_996_G229360.1 [Seminavis robusta]|eukprot:Sro996_g229360.1 n/a (405) ;mRNA; f:36349-38027
MQTRSGNQHKSEATQKPKSQILLDIEKNPGILWKGLLKQYPVYYKLGEPFQTAFRNRYNYLNSIKEKHPQRYWELYAKAGETIARSISESGSYRETKDVIDKEANTTNQEPEAEPATVERQDGTVVSSLTDPTYGATPTKKKILFKKQYTPNKKKPTPQSTPVRKNLTMPSKASSSKKSGGSKGSGSFGSPAAKRQSKFSSLDEAQQFADETIQVDFDFPEKNGGPLIWVQLITECTTSDGSTMYDKVDIRLASIFDLSDAHQIYGGTVCEGRAFLLRLPWVPNFILRNHKQMLKKEKKKCGRTKKKLAAACNAILKSQEDDNDIAPRRWKHVLFVFPDEMVVTSDMKTGMIPITDQKMLLNLRFLDIKKTVVGEGEDEEVMEQAFFPSFFSLRVIDEDVELLS